MFWTKLKERVSEGDRQSENVFFRAYLSAIIKNVFLLVCYQKLS